MSKMISVTVPDIGDFKNVPVIEVLVKPGQQVKKEDPLVTLESDKATMDVPAPAAGTIVEIKVKVGDKVSEGSVVVGMEQVDAEKSVVPAPTTAASIKQSTPPPAPTASYAASGKSVGKDIVVLGAGPGGYSAAFRAADLGLNVTLVERYPTLGGVCLNVGCIPSKALLHAAKVMGEAAAFSSHGIDFGKPRVNLDRLREWKSQVVGKLTGGLAGMARTRKVTVVQGVGSLRDAHTLDVGGKTINFSQMIVAVGSRAVSLPFLPKDPRIVDSTGALTLPSIPKRMLVLGGGIIGLEMATVYAALGSEVTVVEMLPGLVSGADRDLVRVWEKFNKSSFKALRVNTKVTAVEAKAKGLLVSFADGEPEEFDFILVSVGRRSNGDQIAADKAGIILDAHNFIAVDEQMRTRVPHIFAIGDVIGQPMLAHKAVHQAHVAAEAAAGEKSFFDARVIPSVAYTDPEIAWVGLTEEEAKARKVSYGRGMFPWAASGRALSNGREEGFTKLLFDSQTHRLLGGGIVGTNAGDLIGEMALAIEMGCDAIDIAKTIHPHPTLCESLGMAAEAYEGHCTDLPPVKKQ